MPHPFGAPHHPTSSPALALGKPVHSSRGESARLSAPFLTAKPATGPPLSPSPTGHIHSSAEGLSNSRDTMGQRKFLAASMYSMRGSLHRQQAPHWRHPPEIRLDDPVSIPVLTRYSAPTTRFGGFGLGCFRFRPRAGRGDCYGEYYKTSIVPVRGWFEYNVLGRCWTLRERWRIHRTNKELRKQAGDNG